MSKKTIDDWLDSLNQDKIDLGLSRVKQVHQKLNLASRMTITVAGTNGKGSTVAILTALLKTQNQKVGSFTSPHIFRYNERIAIDGVPVSDDVIVSAFERIDVAKGDVTLSYFEYAFLVACCVFDEKNVDVQVMEVGLGGRLDAVNVLDADAAIITGIAIDHVDWLGDNLEDIGLEKAGVLRSGQVAAFGSLECPESIKKHAKAITCDLHLAGKDFKFLTFADHFEYITDSIHWQSLQRPNIQGDWQVQNAAAAVNIICRLGFQLDQDKINQAMSNIKLSGRLETVSEQPLVIADVAHNAQSAESLAQWLKQHPVKGKTRAVFSVLNNKQVGSWLSLFDELIDHWFVFELHGERAMPLNDLRFELAEHVGVYSVFTNARQAFQNATLMTESSDRVIVFGSFHVLDEVLSHSNH